MIDVDLRVITVDDGCDGGVYDEFLLVSVVNAAAWFCFFEDELSFFFFHVGDVLVGVDVVDEGESDEEG